MDPSRTYRLAPGFSWRREPFGGILFHFEGRKPDPRLTFVESAFLIDLLELTEQAPLGQIMTEAADWFQLDEGQSRAMKEFFNTLIEREALVPQ